MHKYTGTEHRLTFLGAFFAIRIYIGKYYKYNTRLSQKLLILPKTRYQGIRTKSAIYIISIVILLLRLLRLDTTAVETKASKKSEK